MSSPAQAQPHVASPSPPPSQLPAHRHHPPHHQQQPYHHHASLAAAAAAVLGKANNAQARSPSASPPPSNTHSPALSRNPSINHIVTNPSSSHSQPAPSLVIPVRRVGKYELGKTLGAGTFGKVKYAVDTETGRAVAIKMMDKLKIKEKAMGTQIKKEISIMKLIKHSSVIQLVEVLASESTIYIVLELVTGGELLQKIIEEGRFQEAEARRYFQQLIDGIEHCHNLGIFHRDLKPENLLLDEDGHLKISDFGLSTLSLSGDAVLHTTCGTPHYVAPEVLMDQGYDGRAADVWSAGVILYVLLAGFLPFDEVSMVELFRMILKAEFQFPPFFPRGACDLVSLILNPDPEKRITIAQIKQHPWYLGLPCTPRSQRRSVNQTQTNSFTSQHGGSPAGSFAGISVNPNNFNNNANANDFVTPTAASAAAAPAIISSRTSPISPHSPHSPLTVVTAGPTVTPVPSKLEEHQQVQQSQPPTHIQPSQTAATTATLKPPSPLNSLTASPLQGAASSACSIPLSPLSVPASPYACTFDSSSAVQYAGTGTLSLSAVTATTTTMSGGVSTNSSSSSNSSSVSSPVNGGIHSINDPDDDVKPGTPSGPRKLTAFDLVNMVGGAAVSRMFTAGRGKAKQVRDFTQFTTTLPREHILDKVEQVLNEIPYSKVIKSLREICRIKAVRELPGVNVIEGASGGPGGAIAAAAAAAAAVASPLPISAAAAATAATSNSSNSGCVIVSPPVVAPNSVAPPQPSASIPSLPPLAPTLPQLITSSSPTTHYNHLSSQPSVSTSPPFFNLHVSVDAPSPRPHNHPLSVHSMFPTTPTSVYSPSRSTLTPSAAAANTATGATTPSNLAVTPHGPMLRSRSESDVHTPSSALVRSSTGVTVSMPHHHPPPAAPLAASPPPSLVMSSLSSPPSQPVSSLSTPVSPCNISSNTVPGPPVLVSSLSVPVNASAALSLPHHTPASSNHTVPSSSPLPASPSSSSSSSASSPSPSPGFAPTSNSSFDGLASNMSGPEVMVVQIYQMTPTLHMIECKRQQGDIFQYNEYYHAFKQRFEVFEPRKKAPIRPHDDLISAPVNNVYESPPDSPKDSSSAAASPKTKLRAAAGGGAGRAGAAAAAAMASPRASTMTPADVEEMQRLAAQRVHEEEERIKREKRRIKRMTR